MFDSFCLFLSHAAFAYANVLNLFWTLLTISIYRLCCKACKGAQLSPAMHLKISAALAEVIKILKKFFRTPRASSETGRGRNKRTCGQFFA